MNYYNDHDPKACAWLRELIGAGLIPPGDVDERSITEVQPDDLTGYTQCHFFAGIGGWPYALELAGWPTDRTAWTGSCPCQPFSDAGKREGTADKRHLWPEFYRLIRECKPATVFGEQVASKLGRGWLAGVFADLEDVGYAVAGADLCAAGVGAPHIRQRLWWVGHTAGPTCERGTESIFGSQTPGRSEGREYGRGSDGLADAGEGSGLADAERAQRWVANADSERRQARPGESENAKGAQYKSRRNAHRRSGSRMGNTKQPRLERYAGNEPDRRQPGWVEANQVGSVAKASSDCWISCADGKARRIEPGLEPLVDGLSGRVGLLRGYGNAIVPQVAAAFVTAFMEISE